MHANNLAFTLLDSSNDTLDLAIAWEHEISNPAVPLFLEVFREYMREHRNIFKHYIVDSLIPTHRFTNATIFKNALGILAVRCTSCNA